MVSNRLKFLIRQNIEIREFRASKYRYENNKAFRKLFFVWSRWESGLLVRHAQDPIKTGKPYHVRRSGLCERNHEDEEPSLANLNVQRVKVNILGRQN